SGSAEDNRQLPLGSKAARDRFWLEGIPTKLLKTVQASPAATVDVHAAMLVEGSRTQSCAHIEGTALAFHTAGDGQRLKRVAIVDNATPSFEGWRTPVAPRQETKVAEGWRPGLHQQRCSPAQALAQPSGFSTPTGGMGVFFSILH
ncbi:MAG: hypothetical protein ACRETD_07205, partial [Steroidobacteraceae bacterium]